MSILILTVPGDPHVEAVSAELRARGAAVREYDPSLFPASSSLSSSIGAGGSSACLRTNGTTLRLDDITAVWDRTFAFTKRLHIVKKDLASYIAAESRTFLDGLFYLMPHAFWISEPQNVRSAEIKLRQLQLAAELGLSIPDTYIGNDPEIGRALVERHEHLALKVIHRTCIELDLPLLQKVQKLFHDFRTRKLRRRDADSPLKLSQLEFRREIPLPTQMFARDEARPYLEALPVAPVIIQAYIPKKIELRITVVGDRVFPCAIYSQDGVDGVRVDWRHNVTSVKHEPYALPADALERCLALLRNLRLRFGCIDMIVTPNDDHVFLEINPTGQWLWIEELTGMPIAAAIAELLIRGQGGDEATCQGSKKTGKPLG